MAPKKRRSAKRSSIKKDAIDNNKTTTTTTRNNNQNNQQQNVIIHSPRIQDSLTISFIITVLLSFSCLYILSIYRSITYTTTLLVNVLLSFIGCFIVYKLIPVFSPLLVKASLYGIDMSKIDKVQVPEAMGMISGAIYLVILFLFFPFPFYQYLRSTETISHFPHHQYSEFIAALLSICCMIFLGFADDVLNLKWRHKLFLPTIASLPLLMVYYVNFGSTYIVIPLQLRGYFYDNNMNDNINNDVINLGTFYYVYMSMVAVFCTNAINILAGINGIEVGQSIIISLSIITHNIIMLDTDYEHHIFSIYILVPFLAVSLPLAYHNFYPSSVFVGDTYCYFAGMTFAVVGILGHFSKTMMLFFIPQIINFLYSIPQLFKLVPIPRHRLPSFNRDTGLLEMSRFECKRAELSVFARLILNIFNTCGLLDIIQVDNDDNIVSINNLTIINLVLKYTGPTHEKTLTIYMLIMQIICSIIAFVIRYEAAKLVYNIVQ